jgi:hypothetical protein
VLARQAGLRFRLGEAGAHGSSASKVTIRGTQGQRRAVGIAALSRDIRLEDVDVRDAAIAISVAAPNLQVTRGRIEQSGEAAIFTAATAYSKPEKISLQSVNFRNESRFVLNNVETVVFDDCSFAQCRDRIKEALSKDSRVVLKGCRFDSACG